MDAVALMLDAKREYALQLADILGPFVLGEYIHLYNATKGGAGFKDGLARVPTWNAAMIQERTNRIEAKYTFLTDLITACFVAMTRVLSSIRINASTSPGLRLALPPTTTFVHAVYVNVARELFEDVSALTSRDRAARAALVRHAVDSAVREHLPISEILKAFLMSTVDGDGIDPAAAAAVLASRSMGGVTTPTVPPHLTHVTTPNEEGLPAPPPAEDGTGDEPESPGADHTKTISLRGLRDHVRHGFGQTPPSSPRRSHEGFELFSDAEEDFELGIK